MGDIFFFLLDRKFFKMLCSFCIRFFISIAVDISLLTSWLMSQPTSQCVFLTFCQHERTTTAIEKNLMEGLCSYSFFIFKYVCVRECVNYTFREIQRERERPKESLLSLFSWHVYMNSQIQCIFILSKFIRLVHVYTHTCHQLRSEGVCSVLYSLLPSKCWYQNVNVNMSCFVTVSLNAIIFHKIMTKRKELMF